MSKPKNEPAFPVESCADHEFTGMSLRDYFAVKAMPLAWKAAEDGYFDSGEDSINANVAACAYQMADAMVCARSSGVMSSKLEMPNPTDEELASPEFEAIWQLIKSWDVNVPTHYEGYCGANGSHVKMILDAIASSKST